MYKLLIVDDEKIVRIAMKKIINWNKEGFDLLEMASDGQSALNIVKKEIPSVMITDLKMPKMHGIDLIKSIKKDFPYCKIIVLSNYGEYDLVRKAMKEGAIDYLLKVTLNEKELREILLKVKKQLDTECKDKKIEELKKLKLKEREELAKEKFLKNILKNEIKNKDRFLEKLKKFNLEKFKEEIYLIDISIDNIKKIQLQSKLTENKENFIHSLLEENIGNISCREIVKLINYEYLIIIKSKKDKVFSISKSIMRNVKLYFGFTVSIIISDKLGSLESLNDCYRRINYLKFYKFYQGEKSLIVDDKDISFKKFKYEFFLISKEIKKSIDINDFKKIFKLIEEFIEECSNQLYHPQNVKKFIIYVINYIQGYIVNEKIEEIIVIEEMKENLLNCEYFNELVAGLNEIIKKFSGILIDEKNTEYREEITKIISFIKENIKKKITLSMLAKEVNMNESYLSRIFKKETGKNINYYINDIKMKEAIKLLIKSDSLIKQVSIEVGIEDQFYFNKVFKKFYKVSPTEYKKQYLDNIRLLK